MTTTKAPRPIPADRPPTDPAPAQAASPTSSVTNRQLFFWMYGFLKPVMGLLIVTGSLVVLTSASDILATWQAGKVVDALKLLAVQPTVLNWQDPAQVVDALKLLDGNDGITGWFFGGSADASQLRHGMFILASLVLGGCVARYFREWANVRLSMDMVYWLRESVYDKLQRVGFRFHDNISTGQLINRALTDLQNVRFFVQSSVTMILEIILIVGGYMILLLTMSPWVALLSVVPLPIWLWYILRFSKKIQPASKATMEAEDKSISVLTEAIEGVHVIKAFATEEQEIAKYKKACDIFKECVLTRIRMFANFMPVIRSIASLSHLSLFLLASLIILNGGMSFGDLLVLGAAMGAILGRLQMVAGINEQYQNAIVSARRLHEVLAALPSSPESRVAIDLPTGPGSVKFENVGFGYLPDKPVLTNLNFEVPGGSVIAIVGPTGSGKSTLVSLIARLYDPTEGRVLIDGVDVRDVKHNSLRTQVGYVFQETYLFSDSVAANIAYGRPEISGGQVEAASRLAQAHDFVNDLPKGYETVLGERGASLSGGQRQRIAIARAILTNPRILILDDATAAIDAETDDLIRRGMKFVMQGRTTFIIAHRISTVREADLVLVVEDGQIRQIGPHDKLIEEEGHYRDIAMAQLYGDSDPESPSHMKRMRNKGTGRGAEDSMAGKKVAGASPEDSLPGIPAKDA